MVNYTSTTMSMCEPLIDAQRATVDRYRPALSLSPIPVAVSRIDVQPRTMSPVFAAVMGEVRPDAARSLTFVECATSATSWHRGTTNTVTNTTAFGGFGFDRIVDDIQFRVGPPPPLRRPSV
jgi:hypothetical protein